MNEDRAVNTIKRLEKAIAEADSTAAWTLILTRDIKDAVDLIEAQDKVIKSLLKVGYPHNFQREPLWIVNYMYAITDVIKKAVKISNEVSTIPEGKV